MSIGTRREKKIRGKISRADCKTPTQIVPKLRLRGGGVEKVQSPIPDRGRDGANFSLKVQPEINSVCKRREGRKKRRV